MTESPSLVLFHHDLRLADNPALTAAVRRKQPLICLYTWDPEATDFDGPGAAGRWWLHHSIQAFSAAVKKAGNAFIIRFGRAAEIIPEVVDQFNVSHVFANHACEPSAFREQQDLLTWLEGEHLEGMFFHGNTLVDPTSVQTKAGKPYSVFTPFWRQLQAQMNLAPVLPAPQTLPSPPEGTLKSASLESLELLPKVDWAEGIRQSWSPGEVGAHQAMRRFLRSAATVYSTDRDRPDYAHTSRLSPHLHFGEISPKKVWQTVSRRKNKQKKPQHRKSYDAYLRQIAWREFARYLLYHFPQTVHEPLYPSYQNFPWREEAKALRAWQQGLTGYPIVDAGMRELWKTGWMHNRVRMITASFLTKDLLIPWQNGAAWFWDTLVDADLANNTLGWQWVAGCGADASPFFRIFNPVTQGTKFDPEGRYVRKWVPELAGLPAKWIHEPWNAPADLLADANVQLGETYPAPIVNHQNARDRALSAYRKFQKQGKGPKTSTKAQ